MNTREALLQKYGDTSVKLADVAPEYLGISPGVAERRASKNALPFPTFRVGTKKSPRMVKIDDLAAHIDAKHAAEREEWEKVRSGIPQQ